MTDLYNSGYTEEVFLAVHIVSDVFDSHVFATRTCEQYPDIEAAAEKISAAIGELYQLIGQKLHAEETAMPDPGAP